MNVKAIKELRDKTQAGYSDCKKALVESNWDLVKAERHLIDEGLRVVDGAGANISINGVIHSYIHPGNRIGVIVEVGCETDFVAKTDELNSFAKEIALQVASMKPQFVSRDDIPFWRIAQEMSYRKERLERESGKASDVIVDAEMKQWYSEVCLLEQAYVRDNKKTVKDLLGELVLKTQENCKVRKFKRWEVGMEEEEIECLEEEFKSGNKFVGPASVILFILSLIFLYALFGGN